jgi:hypothetical protein
MGALELLLFTALAPSPQPAQAATVTVGAVSAIAELDAGKLKGEPARLAWSPDGAQLYLQMAEVKSNGSRTERHYLLSAAEPNAKVKSLDAMPDWAGKYWAWKSGQSAPGAPAFKIEVTDETKTVRATAAPMGGDLARGGGSSGGGEGTSIAEATAVAQQSQQARVITLKLRGHTVGEFTNGPLMPGLTFGWAPESVGLVAFTDKNGKVVLMDQGGKTKDVSGTSDALLPAWSEDGSRLAFLKKDGRKKYTVQIAGVGR